MIYLIHFLEPISERHTTQHYIGYTDSLPERIQSHRSGYGARLTQVAKERGIGFRVVRLWRGDRSLERKLKNRHDATRMCPVCNPGNSLAMGDSVALMPEECKPYEIPF